MFCIRKLNVSYKGYVFFRYNEETRRPKMAAVLRAVRCQFLSPAFLKEQMKNCDMIRKLPACREYLAQIFTVCSKQH